MWLQWTCSWSCSLHGRAVLFTHPLSGQNSFAKPFLLLGSSLPQAINLQHSELLFGTRCLQRVWVLGLCNFLGHPQNPKHRCPPRHYYYTVTIQSHKNVDSYIGSQRQSLSFHLPEALKSMEELMGSTQREKLRDSAPGFKRHRAVARAQFCSFSVKNCPLPRAPSAKKASENTK